MMPLPEAVARTTAQATRSFRPALLSMFLETRHCRRMSIGQHSARSATSRPFDVQPQTTLRTPTKRNEARSSDRRRTPFSTPAERRPEERPEKKKSTSVKIQRSASRAFNSPSPIHVSSSSQSQPRPPSRKQRSEKSTSVNEQQRALRMSDSSSPTRVLSSSQSQWRPPLKKRRPEKKSTFVKEQQRDLRVSNSSSSTRVLPSLQSQSRPPSRKQRPVKESISVKEQQRALRVFNSTSPTTKAKGNGKFSSSQTTRPHLPQISGGSIDGRTRNLERGAHEGEPKGVEAEEEEQEVFKQAPNPPLPKHAFNPHPSAEGISGKAAAIAYLRICGLANRGRRKTFYAVLAWILRHAARDLGFEIVPDGFVRISDLLRFELFQMHTLESFAQACISDIFDRFEVMSLPDVVDGQMREIWWARARASQTMPGVHASNKRIINMGKLQTVVYRAPFADWPTIQKYGILEDPDRLIRLYQSGTPYFHNIIPRHSKQICITIDAQRAAELGVMFFHTESVELVAVGRNGVIPLEAIRSVVKLEVMKEDLI